MASRFYTPLEEEANDPRYDEGTAFDEAPAAYDTPQEQPDSPFSAPAPGVKQLKQQHDPFSDPDPRLTELDQQIKSRPRSIGGMIAAFSPQGDKSLANLMAQRHLVGAEVHGDRQLQRQIESSRMLQESAYRRADALEKAAADRAAASRDVGAGSSAARIAVGAGNNAASVQGSTLRANRPFAVGAGASVYNPATGENSEQNEFRPPAPPRPAAAPKPGQDPATLLLQKKLVGLQQAITKAQVSGTADPAVIGELQRQYNEAKRQMGTFGTQPSAAQSTAPGVAASAAPKEGDIQQNAAGAKRVFQNGQWVPFNG